MKDPDLRHGARTLRHHAIDKALPGVVEGVFKRVCKGLKGRSQRRAPVLRHFVLLRTLETALFMAPNFWQVAF